MQIAEPEDHEREISFALFLFLMPVDSGRCQLQKSSGVNTSLTKVSSPLTFLHNVIGSITLRAVM